MRLNQDTALQGERVVLVPYRAGMVATYHGWMVSQAARGWRLNPAAEPAARQGSLAGSPQDCARCGAGEPGAAREHCL